jgi:hypothetical protein
MEKPDLVLSPAWRDFIDDVKSSEYQEEIMRIFNTRNTSFFYWWQIARTGCAVSPHCDSANKIGSHLFYFNTESDWKDEWGGRTLILDDEKKMNEASAPEIENFKKVQAPEILGNKNLLFGRTPHSWHAVAPLTSPPEAARKIFTVIINRRPDLLKRSLSFMKRAMLPAPQKGQTMM